MQPEDKLKNRSHMETPAEYNERMIKRAVEEVRQNGYLEIKLKLHVDKPFSRVVFMEEFSGILATAVKILKAYKEKYGRINEKKTGDP